MLRRDCDDGSCLVVLFCLDFLAFEGQRVAFAARFAIRDEVHGIPGTPFARRGSQATAFHHISAMSSVRSDCRLNRARL